MPLIMRKHIKISKERGMTCGVNIFCHGPHCHCFSKIRNDAKLPTFTLLISKFAVNSQFIFFLSLRGTTYGLHDSKIVKQFLCI